MRSHDARFTPTETGYITAAQLSPLRFVHYRIRLAPRAPLVLPLYGRGAILRGAFGITLRQLVCHDLTLDCRACPLSSQCPYPETFEPRPPEGGNRLSNFTDIPRPFVFDPPIGERSEFGPSEVVEFGLTAVGRASRLAPYFVTAFRKLADDGLGPRRARFDLVEVTALGLKQTNVTAPDEIGTPPRPAANEQRSHQIEDETPIYRNTEPLIRVSAPSFAAADLVHPEDSNRSRVVLRFLTPIDLRDRGAQVDVPEFGPVVRRLRDRASSLAAFFGDGPLDLDFKGISASADTVRLVENRTRMLAIDRRSTKTGQHHDIGGFIGDATYEGEAIGRLMPLLRLGEVIHVGKHAAFGNGQLEVVS